MKFVSWNVNGLRACLAKGFAEYYESCNADFFCLQEIKLSEGQLDVNFAPYQYFNYAQKKGYSGTAVFTKHEPMSVEYGDGDEGRMIILEYKDFYVVTVYTPNAQDGLARIGFRLEWDEYFRNKMAELDKKKPVLICGDMNVARSPIELKNPKSNEGNAGYSIQERESFQKLLDKGFIDSFRYFYPDREGAYSWWSYRFHAREKNAGWRIDYWLASSRIRDRLADSVIESSVFGSDHCPVVLLADL